MYKPAHLKIGVNSLIFLFFTFSVVPLNLAGAQPLRGVICENAEGQLVIRRACRGKNLTRFNMENVIGTQGIPGERGETGKDGQDGRDGIDGSAGADGKDGRDGAIGFFFNGSSADLISSNGGFFPANATATLPLPVNILEQHQTIPIIGTQCTRIAAALVLDGNAANEVELAIVRTVAFGVAFNLIPVCTIPAGSDRCEGEVSAPIQAFEGAIIAVQSSSPINRRIKWHYRCMQT